MISKAIVAQLLVCVVTLGDQALGGPVITDFSPPAGTPGDEVTLSGSGLAASGITVRFWNGAGGVIAPVFVNSDTLITVVVPSGSTTGPISVQQGTDPPSYSGNDFLVVGFGPYISGFSPAFAAVGTTVVVSGVHLTNTTAVLFNGTNATEIAPNATGTQITTRVPPGATSGPITVSTIYGTSNSPTAFTVVGPGPFITGFSPVSGGGGTRVLITGLHFTGVTNVTFNGQAGIILTATSDTLIQVAAPSAVSSGPITVSTPLGSAVTISNFFGQPVVTGFSPVSGRAGTNVLISGTNFLGATAAFFGGVPSTNIMVVSNSSLRAAVPTGALTGLIRVAVPGASTFSSSNFVIRPTIYGFSPVFGPPGTSVTVTGANLSNGAPVIRFNGVLAATPTKVTFSSLVAVVPTGASTGPISVTTSDGGDTNSSLFFLPAKITSFTPTNSAPGSRVIITGQNLTGATAVSFNGAPAADFIISNNTSIGATVPGNVVSGPISATTPAGVAVSSNSFYGPPLITSFTPTHGLPGTNVTIHGGNFLGGTAQFNGLNAALVSLNNTQIVATVPIGAQTGPITVFAPAGTNVSLAKFALDYTSDLQVFITNSPNPVLVSSNLLYTISLFNAGPSDAPNAAFTNLLSPNVRLVSVTTTIPWVLQTNGNVLIGSFTNYAAGDASDITILVTPLVPGTITDTISLGSDNADPAPSNNTASISATASALPLLSIGRLADQIQISWPATLSNYMLQFEDALSPNQQWLADTNAPSLAGGVKTVIETNAVPARFYRLQQ